MKKSVVIGLCMVFFLHCSVPAALATEQVQVTLPSFPITLNGQTIQNDYSKYPFIVYKDITYIPMTYYDSRLLGIKTDWSTEDGLSITSYEDNLVEYKREILDTKNHRKQTASISESRVTLNGTVIDNQRETYPLLLFRNVTYFPLTWRFAVEEFGWNYNFSHENGLVISNSSQNTVYPLHWNGNVDFFGSMMGTGDLEFGISFLPKTQTLTTNQAAQQLSEQTISLYHFPPAPVTVLPSEQSWEYHIYYIQDGQEYLVYKKLVPFFSGELNGRQYARNRISINYWNSNTLKKGSYIIKLIHPKTLCYSTPEGETISINLREGTGNRFFFESNVTIQ